MNILDPEVLVTFFKNYHFLFLLGVFVSALGITYYLIPKILWVTKEKDLLKPVIGRSAHSVATPSFGGVAFFITFVLLFSLLQCLRLEYAGNHLMASMIILFMVGLKDDLVVSSARVKIVGQIVAAGFITFSPALHITSLDGFLGIFEIPAVLGYLFTGFLVIAIINAYNLIDGINGLAGIIGIVICSAYGFMFYRLSLSFYLLICCLTAGILLAFLCFNLSRKNAKIFMGDAGSLIIGLIIAFLTIKILALTATSPLPVVDKLPSNRILFVLAVLFIPIFDTSRVMLVRMLKGRSPFEADRNHSHHVLLDLGLDHVQASMALGGINLLVILCFGILQNIMNTAWLGVSMAIIYGAVFVFFEASSYYLRVMDRKVHGVRSRNEKRIIYKPSAYMERAV